jgi:hypothetical protein
MFKPETIARVDEIIAKLDDADGMFVQRMVNKIEELQRKITQQDKRLSDYGWIVSPDKSGGAFTQDEIDRSRNGGWQ